jgi:asparagine synthase (glutamine-hydrolysing)
MASGCTGWPITWPRRTPMRFTACWCRAGGGPKTLFWARQRRRAFWPSDLPDAGGLGDAERMMQLDMLAYLPDDILTKVDRAAMAVSLESRAPLLDHRVVEFAWSMPYDLKVRDGQSKWLLRQVLYRHVPRELIERPKQGFEVPIGLWLRGALKDWAAALLEPGRLRNEGYFDPNMVDRVWQEHLSGRWNHGLALWSVLMFQAWLEAQDQARAADPAREMALSPSVITP